MKTISVQSNRVEPNTLFVDDVFSKALYTNANIPRIVLRRPIRQMIRCGQWNRIDLELVTEMGLPVENKEAILLSGKIIASQSGYYETLMTVDLRPIFIEDGWETEVAHSEGFNAYSSIGGLEYRVNHTIDQPFFIMLQSNNESILPLCVGPIHIGPDKEHMDTMNEQQQQQYRAIEVKNSRFFLIKEQWEDGTPGKVWDSALVIVNLLMKNVDMLLGKRILDLSAGTGYIGLSLAQFFQSSDYQQKPSVVLSDIPEALDLIKVNQELNNIRPDNDHLKIESLLWGNRRNAKNVLKTQRGEELDIIIASDIIYRKNDFSKIVTAFQQLCTPRTTIYMGYKTRGLKPFEEKEFFDICKKPFNIQLLDCDPRTGVKLYKIKKRSRLCLKKWNK